MLSLPKVIEILKTLEFSIEFYLVFEYNWYCHYQFFF